MFGLATLPLAGVFFLVAARVLFTFGLVGLHVARDLFIFGLVVVHLAWILLTCG